MSVCLFVGASYGYYTYICYCHEREMSGGNLGANKSQYKWIPQCIKTKEYIT